MITCYLQGGLGNQMFQVAASLNLAWENDDEAIFCRNAHYLPLQGRDVTNYEDNVFREVRFADKVSFSRKHEESSHVYEPIPYENGLCLVGYYQSEKYFEDNKEKILEIFQPPEKFQKELDDPSVAMHLRRGDCVKNPDIHPIMPVDYYRHIYESLKGVGTFNIFSDEIEWCKEKFDFIEDVNFVEGHKDWEDMYLMSQCDYIAIANSTFSWWSAQLSDAEEIFTPSNERWFGPNGPPETDIVPEDRWKVVLK